MNIMLTDQKCVACEGGVPPLTPEEVTEFRTQVPDWIVSADSLRISRRFVCQNFKDALAFINKVGELAEIEGHHPDIHLTDFKNVTIELMTYAISGLSTNDFILAAKIDTLPR